MESVGQSTQVIIPKLKSQSEIGIQEGIAGQVVTLHPYKQPDTNPQSWQCRYLNLNFAEKSYGECVLQIVISHDRSNHCLIYHLSSV